MDSLTRPYRELSSKNDGEKIIQQENTVQYKIGDRWLTRRNWRRY